MDTSGFCSYPNVKEKTLNFTCDGLSIAISAMITYAIRHVIQQAENTATVETWSFISTKSEEKEDIIVQTKKQTIIYRYGGSNPGNLTPKSKDMFTGLSFSLTPPPPGVPAVVTTIEALNATGMVIAFQDKPNHVCVIPAPHMGTLQEWIETGSSHPCTWAVKAVVIKWGGF